MAVDPATIPSVAATMIIVMATLMQVVVTRCYVEMVPMSIDLGWVPIVVAGVMVIIVSTVAPTTVIAAGLVAMTTVTVPNIDVDTGTTKVNAKWAGCFDASSPQSSQS